MVVFVKSDVMAATPSSRITVSMIVGKKKQLKPKGAKGKIVWKTSKKTIATVSSKGLVTAKKKGVAVITATTKSKKWTYKVIVKESPVISVRNLRLEVGGYLGMGSTNILFITGASSRPIWKNSNKSVITLRKQSTYKYKVVAKKKGTSNITVKVAGKILKCKVTVKQGTNPYKIQFVNSKRSIDILNETYLMLLYTSPDDMKRIQFSSSNPDIVKVSRKNGYILATGVSSGTATVTATLDGVSTSCKVTVNPFKSFELCSDDYPDENTKTIQMGQGEETTCWISSNPRNDHWESSELLKITSSDPTIASVTMENGNIVIRGIKAGIATITASADKESSSCIVTVIEKPDVLINISGHTEGDSAKISFNITNSDKRKVFITSAKDFWSWPAVWREKKVTELTGTRIIKEYTYGSWKEDLVCIKEKGKDCYELPVGNYTTEVCISNCSYEDIMKIKFAIAVYDGSKFETWPYEINLKEQ